MHTLLPVLWQEVYLWFRLVEFHWDYYGFVHLTERASSGESSDRRYCESVLGTFSIVCIGWYSNWPDILIISLRVRSSTLPMPLGCSPKPKEEKSWSKKKVSQYEMINTTSDTEDFRFLNLRKAVCSSSSLSYLWLFLKHYLLCQQCTLVYCFCDDNNWNKVVDNDVLSLPLRTIW